MITTNNGKKFLLTTTPRTSLPVVTPKENDDILLKQTEYVTGLGKVPLFSLAATTAQKTSKRIPFLLYLVAILLICPFIETDNNNSSSSFSFVSAAAFSSLSTKMLLPLPLQHRSLRGIMPSSSSSLGLGLPLSLSSSVSQQQMKLRYQQQQQLFLKYKKKRYFNLIESSFPPSSTTKTTFPTTTKLMMTVSPLPEIINNEEHSLEISSSNNNDTPTWFHRVKTKSKHLLKKKTILKPITTLKNMTQSYLSSLTLLQNKRLRRRKTWYNKSNNDYTGITGGTSRMMTTVTPTSNTALFSHHHRYQGRYSLIQQQRLHHHKKRNPLTTITKTSSPKSTSTQLSMVLTIPEAIIEQASTQNLLDDLIDESVRTKSRKPIMRQFDPSSGWIWRRWRGTIFSETWKTCVKNMCIAAVVAILHHKIPRFREAVTGFNVLWGQLLSVTTFTLTFFLNVSYALWRKCQELSRRLQGRLNDLGMTLAAHAERTTPASPDEPSVYTAAARQFLDLFGRYVRVFNLLTYASFTRSHRPILTPRGMRRLVERGILTSQEMQILVEAELPPTMRHNAVILWIIRLFVEGMQCGHVRGGDGFEQQFMEKVHVIRAQYGAIGDELQGRMPLAYAHIVQVLVDVILWMYPFQALSSGMPPALGILGCGLLTMCYQGLFDLAKQFLDPYDNENYGKGEDPLCVDTLVAETNAGSVRWMNGFEKQPFSSQRLRDGELFNSLLPLRGYSVEELQEMQERKEREEEEKLKKEQERLEREERERLEREEQERLREIEERESKGQELDGITSEDENYNLLGEDDIEKIEVVDENTEKSSPHEDIEIEEIDIIPVSFETESDVSNEEEVKDEFEQGDKEEKEPKVHKVFSLEGGIPVTLDEKTDNLAVTNTDDVSGEFEGLDKVAIDSEIAEKALDEEKKEGILKVEDDDDDDTATNLHDEKTTNGEVRSETINGDAAANDDIKSESINGDTTSSVDAEKDKSVKETVKEEDILKDEDMYKMLDFDLYEDLLLLDDVGPDGQEYRLSQILADEEFEDDAKEEAEVLDVPLTYEDYSRKAADIIEAAEDELLETAEILNASPGAEATMDARPKEALPFSPTMDSQSKTRVPDNQAVNRAEQRTYDQTRLDSVSQLWGAAPEVLDFSMPEEPASNTKYDDANFNGISQLWGESPTVSGGDASDSIKQVAFDSVSQLWGEPNGSPAEKPPKDVGGGTRSSHISAPSAYGELDWFEEVGPDGTEYRLSQMLADEEYEEAAEPEVAAPLSLEDYNKQAAEIIEAAKDERTETDAILNAPLGGAPLSASSFDANNERREGAEDRAVDTGKTSTAGSETAAVAKAIVAAAEKVKMATEKKIMTGIDETLAVLEMDEEDVTDESSKMEKSLEGDSLSSDDAASAFEPESSEHDTNGDNQNLDLDEEITSSNEDVDFLLQTDSEGSKGGDVVNLNITSAMDDEEQYSNGDIAMPDSDCEEDKEI